MTVPRKFSVLLALGALLLGAGCGGSDRTPVAAEVDEPSYRDGQQLKNQGRNNEALTAFLRVIEKRGEQNSAESHLEAGLIYLNQIKDPVEAIHQFRKYLELQPNSKQAPYVRGQVDNAQRQFALMLRGPNPLDSVQSDLQDRVARLERENAELQAQLTSVPVTAPSSFVRLPRPSDDAVTLGTRVAPPSVVPPVVRTTESPGPFASQPPQGAPGGRQFVIPSAPKPAATAPPSPPATARAPAGRTHTVQAGEGLFGISKQYYGTGSMAKAHAIYEANRDVMKSESDLRPGMELKIP
jgi:tetratricopeptide (TPR) repeat protein